VPYSSIKKPQKHEKQEQMKAKISIFDSVAQTQQPGSIPISQNVPAQPVFRPIFKIDSAERVLEFFFFITTI
jgi:hypothetical protein